MSGWPRCASVAPSHSAMSAWTIDCGCTTTSMRSYGVPNSQCASITSRPLFISVAESIVILPPIAQVGWRSAASTRDPASSARVRPRNGPPDAVSVEPLDRARRARRRSAGAARSARSRPGSAARRSPRPAPSRARRRRRATPCWRARRRCPRSARRSSGPSPAEPTIALSTRSAPDSATSRTSPSGPASTSPSVHASAARAAASGSLSAIRPHAVRARLRDERLVRALGRQPDELERLRRARDDVERLGADRAGRAEDQEPLHPAAQCGRGRDPKPRRAYRPAARSRGRRPGGRDEPAKARTTSADVAQQRPDEPEPHDCEPRRRRSRSRRGAPSNICR